MTIDNTRATVDQLAIAELRRFEDKRGLLLPLEVAEHVPFTVRRIFWVLNVPPAGRRGGHAHRHCHQFFVCTSGQLVVEAFDGIADRKIRLGAGQALHISPGIFTTEEFLDEGTALTVLCDRPFEPDDYLPTRAALIEFHRHR